MWSAFKSVKGEYLVKDIPNMHFKGIVYMSLDCGVTWNYLGQKYPTPEVWTWCTSDTVRIINYINKSLFEGGFLPVFYTMGASKEYAEKVCSYLEFQPPVFVKTPPETIHGLIMKSWLERKSDIVESLPNIKCTFEPSCFFYNLGPNFPPIQEDVINYSQEQLGLGINISHIIDGEPKLVILVGQPGSGKSTIANKFAEKEWTIIDEKEAARIRRTKSSKVTFYDLVKNIGLSEGIGSKGVVVDCTNPKTEQRDFFAGFAIQAGKSYCVGWITKPGVYYNEKRAIPVPMPALYYYAKHFESPTEQKCGIRLI